MSRLLKFLQEREGLPPEGQSLIVQTLLTEWLEEIGPEQGHEFTRLLCVAGVNAPARVEPVKNGVGVRLRIVRPFDDLAASVSLFVSRFDMQGCEVVPPSLARNGGASCQKRRTR